MTAANTSIRHFSGTRRSFAFVLLLVFFASVFLLVLSARRGASGALIVSDGKAYYAWARSVLIDGDIDFENDYRLLYPPDPLPPDASLETPAGHVVNKYPVGLAVIEMPGALAGHLLAGMTGREQDGVSAPYQLSVALSLSAFSVFSFYLLFLGLLRVGAGEGWSALLSGAALLATNTIHYVAKEPAMSHAAGLALFNIAFWLAVRWRDKEREVGVCARVELGLVLGLMFLVRNSNVLMMPILAWLVARGRGFSVRKGIPVAAAALAVAAIQPLALHALWGEWMLSGYTQEGFTAGPAGIVNALFSARHGLFVYHPWYLVLVVMCCWGLAYRDARMPSALALLSLCLVAAMNGTWWCWWFGDSFGNRGFIELLGPLSVAAGVVAGRHAGDRLMRVLFVIALACIAINVYLWFGYLLGAYAHDGAHSVMEAYGWVF